MPGRDVVLPWAAFAGLVLVWGSTFLFIRIGNEEGHAAFSAALLRLILAAGVLLAVAVVRKMPFPRGRGLAVAAVAGVLMFGVNFALLYWGEQTVASGVAAVLWAVFPTLIVIGAAIWLPDTEPLRARVLSGALLSALGLVVVFWRELAGDAPIAGLVAILLGIMAAAAAQLLMKRHGGDIHPVVFNGLGALIGAVVLAPLAYTWGDGLSLPPTPRAWLSLGVLVLVASIGAFVTYFWLLQRWPATRLSFQTVLSPLIAVALGAWILSEPVGPTFLAGSALVLAGTWIAVRTPHNGAHNPKARK